VSLRRKDSFLTRVETPKEEGLSSKGRKQRNIKKKKRGDEKERDSLLRKKEEKRKLPEGSTEKKDFHHPRLPVRNALETQTEDSSHIKEKASEPGKGKGKLATRRL